MNTLVFDIETIPDIELGKKVYDIKGLNDEETFNAMQSLLAQKTPGNTFFPLFMHKIVAISLVLKTNSSFKIWSLGNIDSSETEILSRFFDGLAQYSPTIVSWNGTNFDLPVIHYRALKNAVVGERYWETGKTDQSFKWNNYINRYHERHTDIMDVLAGFSPRANASLQNISLMLGLPGKMGIDGSKVHDMYKQNKIEAIRDYCEVDVLNTYLVYLRFELIKNQLSKEQYSNNIEEVKNFLHTSDKEHFSKYLDIWD